VLRHCDDTGGRFAILDSRPGATVDEVLAQRAGLVSVNGALYYPWVRTTAGPAPPCGHVAGVYARTDARVGVHKAPANEALEGVVDVEMPLTDAQQAVLNPAGVDCLRARPGRGIRVWGARTIATDPSWRYINARRLVLRVARWLERNGATAAFEVSEPRLWSQMTRDVNAYLMDLFRRGALAGRTPEEAFYVKCDAGTNPPDVRDAGLLVTEVGIAPTVPGEFLVVRITHGPAGVVAGAPTPSI
jgi:phage tail sheath protein FI